MLARTIGRAAAVAGFILSGGLAWAQTDQKPADMDALRRGVAQGAAFCKANLGSAPPDLKLGEVEEFCTCMGVHEFAMTDMTNEAKTSLRPRQQQMCVEIVRKQGTTPAPAPAQAVPPSPPPAAPAPAEPPAVSAPAPAAAQPPAVERIEQWTLNTNITGAPVAYARASDSNILAAIMMYCRAKDSIGLRVVYKGAHEKQLSLNQAGDVTEFNTDKNGLVSQKAWADFLKEWLESEKYFTPARRKQPGYSGGMMISAGTRDSGSISLDGLGDARKRLLAMCADAIGKGAPEGNYITTGLAAFDTEVLVGSAPPGTPASVAVVAPRAEAEPARPVARRPGALPFEGTWRLRAEEACGSNMGMTITKDAIFQGAPGNVSVSKIIAVKRLNEMAYRLTIQEAEKQRSGRTTVHIGIENGDAITGDGPIFPGHSVEYLRCPDRAPSGAAAVAPRAPAREPKAAPNCSATFERTYAALRRKETDLAGQTGALMQNTPRFFWDFCPITRQSLAVWKQIVAAVNACPSHPRAAGIKSEATARVAKRQQELQRPRCM